MPTLTFIPRHPVKTSATSCIDILIEIVGILWSQIKCILNGNKMFGEIRSRHVFSFLWEYTVSVLRSIMPGSQTSVNFKVVLLGEGINIYKFYRKNKIGAGHSLYV